MIVLLSINVCGVYVVVLVLLFVFSRVCFIYMLCVDCVLFSFRFVLSHYKYDVVLLFLWRSGRWGVQEAQGWSERLRPRLGRLRGQCKRQRAKN